MQVTTEKVDQEIKDPENVDQEINAINVEKEIGDVLRVSSSDDASECESVLSNAGKPQKKAKLIKTRKQLIERIKDTCKHLGEAEEDIRALRLHRKRKNSLDALLKEKVAQMITRRAIVSSSFGETPRTQTPSTDFEALKTPSTVSTGQKWSPNFLYRLKSPEHRNPEHRF